VVAESGDLASKRRHALQTSRNARWQLALIVGGGVPFCLLQFLHCLRTSRLQFVGPLLLAIATNHRQIDEIAETKAALAPLVCPPVKGSDQHGNAAEARQHGQLCRLDPLGQREFALA